MKLQGWAQIGKQHPQRVWMFAFTVFKGEQLLFFLKMSDVMKVWSSANSHCRGSSWGGWAPPSGLRSHSPGSCGSGWCHRWASSAPQCRPPRTGGWTAQTRIYKAQRDTCNLIIGLMCKQGYYLMCVDPAGFGKSFKTVTPSNITQRWWLHE